MAVQYCELANYVDIEVLLHTFGGGCKIQSRNAKVKYEKAAGLPPSHGLLSEGDSLCE